MRILVQNKLLLAVVPPQRSPTHIALGRLQQHNPGPGPALAGRRTPPPPHTESKLGHGYVQLYLGKDPDSHSKAEHNPGVSRDPGRVVASPWTHPPTPASATCQTSPWRPRAAKAPPQAPGSPFEGCGIQELFQK